jgi:hypothetical protein
MIVDIELPCYKYSVHNSGHTYQCMAQPYICTIQHRVLSSFPAYITVHALHMNCMGPGKITYKTCILALFKAAAAVNKQERNMKSLFYKIRGRTTKKHRAPP